MIENVNPLVTHSQEAKQIMKVHKPIQQLACMKLDTLDY